MAPDFCSCSRRGRGCNLVDCALCRNAEHGQKDKSDGVFYFFRVPYPGRSSLNVSIPHDYEVRYQIGELYFFQSREGDAFRQYRRVLSLIDRVEQLLNKKEKQP